LPEQRPSILGICGSLRSRSRNRQLLALGAALAQPHAVWRDYDGLGELPHFNPDIEQNDALPDEAANLRNLVQTSDALIISTPEYAHGLPGSLKNALDWLVGDPHFSGKTVALWSPTDRSLFAQAQLREVLRTMDAVIVEDACFNWSGALEDPALQQRLQSAITCLTG
jgi:chromate reductase, NAD(P)H dehydrogenase (quinone)